MNKEHLFPALPKAHSSPDFSGLRNNQNNQARQNNQEPDVNPAIDLTSRCVGMRPISTRDLEKSYKLLNEQYQGDEKFQIGGAIAARDFLITELNFTVREADDLRIRRVFYPAAGPSTKTLYVEFYHEDELKMVRKNAHKMKENEYFDPSLVQYVPKSLDNRYRAIMKRAYQERHPENSSEGKHTKICFAMGDFELRIREKSDKTPWAKIDPIVIPNLPPQTPKIYFTNPIIAPQPQEAPKPPSNLNTNNAAPSPQQPYNNAMTAPTYLPSNPTNNHPNPNMQTLGKRVVYHTTVPKLLPRTSSDDYYELKTSNKFDPIENDIQA